MRKLKIKFKLYKKIKKKNIWLVWAIAGLLIAGTGYATLQIWYRHNLSAVSSSTNTVYFTIEKGDSVKKIATNLKRTGLIRSTFSFQSYVRGNNLFDSLQYGTYSLSPSMNVQTIVKKFSSGQIATNLVTILPGKRLDQIKQTFLQSGFTSSEVETAFNPKTYGGIPALASLPAGASLEGYLYPDSYQKDSATTATDIVKESLNEFEKKLTPAVIKGFAKQGLNTYEGIILSSIVYAESDNPDYQSTIAQVFLSRLNQGMMLGSDVTAFYGAKIAGVEPSVGFDSAFNTRIHTGLPPGPIGNFNASALTAVASPDSTDFLYFVADENGGVHFTRTEAEHEAAISKYCGTACSQ